MADALTPAGELREAARLMRERAGKATPGPWAWEPTGDKDSSWAVGLVQDEQSEQALAGRLDHGQGIVIDGVCESIDGRLADAEHIASWHPGVALAIADWLDVEGAILERRMSTESVEVPALRVARAYLGTRGGSVAALDGRQDVDAQALAAAEPPPGSFAADMLPPDVRERLAASAAAFRCPNDPPCAHPGLLHDIEDYADPRPRCCADGCPCGAAAPAPPRLVDWQKLDGWTDCAPPHPATHRCVTCATDDELLDMLGRSLRDGEPA